jgi:hypothetical protein
MPPTIGRSDGLAATIRLAPDGAAQKPQNALSAGLDEQVRARRRVGGRPGSPIEGLRGAMARLNQPAFSDAALGPQACRY